LSNCLIGAGCENTFFILIDMPNYKAENSKSQIPNITSCARGDATSLWNATVSGLNFSTQYELLLNSKAQIPNPSFSNFQINTFSNCRIPTSNY